MKNKKLALGLGIALVALVAAVLVIWGTVGKAPSDSGETSEITVTLVMEDGSEQVMEFETQKQTLGEVLYENELISEEEFNNGYFTVLNGVSADYNTDGAWWCVTEDGEMTTVGINEQIIEDGDSFEITYTPA